MCRKYEHNGLRGKKNQILNVEPENKVTFNHDFLKVQRDFEYDVIVRLLPAGARLLEIGAGPGYQSQRLQGDGFDVSAIDLRTSNYSDSRVFNVVEYDGRNIPFAADVFDVVFSSSVLEHVTDLPALQNEIHRVLKPGGMVMHVLPSASWRVSTLLSGYAIGLMETARLVTNVLRSAFSKEDVNWDAVRSTWRFLVKDYWLPARHGESGNAFTEVWFFSRFYWLGSFKNSDFHVQKEFGAGLFYSGNMLFGRKLAIESRVGLAKILGSACRIYVLTSSK